MCHNVSSSSTFFMIFQQLLHFSSYAKFSITFMIVHHFHMISYFFNPSPSFCKISILFMGFHSLCHLSVVSIIFIIFILVVWKCGGATPPPPLPPAFLKALQACRSKEASFHHHICNEGWLYRSFCLRMGVGLHPRLDARCGNTNHLFAAGGAGGGGCAPPTPRLFSIPSVLDICSSFQVIS